MYWGGLDRFFKEVLFIGGIERNGVDFIGGLGGSGWLG